jgi:nitrile hydratase accessory protein
LNHDPLSPLARADDTPVFDEPWQAQSLALAFNLIDRGQFTASEWSATLGAELESARVAGEADDMTSYYSAVLRALEKLLAVDDAVSGDSIDERTEAWRDAYLQTPHGQPVELKNR